MATLATGGIEREIALDRLVRQQARDAVRRRVDKPAREWSESAIRSEDGILGRLEELAVDPNPDPAEEAAERELAEAEALEAAAVLADRVEEYLRGPQGCRGRPREHGGPVPMPRVILMGAGAWPGPSAGPCPVCSGLRLKLAWYCAYCDRSGGEILLMPAVWSRWSRTLRPTDRPAPRPEPVSPPPKKPRPQPDSLLMDRSPKPSGFSMIDALREQRRSNRR